MGIFDSLFGKKKKAQESQASKSNQPKIVPKEQQKGSAAKEPQASKSHPPKFVRKERNNENTYEIYNGIDAESAKDFLLTKRVDKKLYYILVETPEGNWGMDIEGLYLEHLLPWQTSVNSAKCTGIIIPMSHSNFGLNSAARGFNDNFIVKVQCGKCENQWSDGVRYQNITVVRCPKCKTLNKVDSGNIKVVFV